jgi:putative ABC transport system permease protein
VNGDRFFRRWLLRAYPARFRDEYGEEMMRLFAEQWRDARLTGGTAIVWFRVAGDTLRTAPREHGYLIAQDLRHAWRSLVRTPGFTAVAVATLAIGIGATAAMFSIAHAVLWRPLPFSDPGALVSVAEARLDTRVPTDSSLANYADWRDQQRVFDRIAAYTDLTFNLTGVSDPERLRAIQMSASLLPLLGIEPFMGRNFSAAEDSHGAAPVAILSHQLWRRTFGSDPNIVGRAVLLNDRSFTIVGVMPAGFQFPVQVDLIDIYTPIEIDDFEQMRARDGRLIHVIGRLRAGVTQADAERDMAIIAGRLEREYPEANRGWGIVLQPVAESVAGGTRTALLLLLGAVVSVLAMTCVNLASLSLARTSARARDLSVRAALGATRPVLLRLVVTETALVAACGGLVGLLAFAGFKGALIAVAPASIPRLGEAGLDLNTCLFAAGVTLLVVFVISLASWSGVAAPRPAALSERTSSGSLSQSRVRAALLTVQVAVGLVLLTGAGLMTRSLVNLLTIETGFDPRALVAMGVELPRARYPTPEAQAHYYDDVLERARLRSGVDSVAAAFPLPFGSPVVFPFSIDGQPEDGRVLGAFHRTVSPGYFKTMRIPLVRGRLFTDADGRDNTPVVLINQQMASRFWPGGDAIGRRITVIDRNDRDIRTTRTIVGIVGDVRQVSLDRPPGPEILVPYRQAPSPWMALIARGGPDAGKRLGQAIRDTDPYLPMPRIELFEDRLSRSAASRKFVAGILNVFAAMAVVLTMIGVIGMTSQAVTQRTREIGIRMALGARRADVLRLVGSGTLRVVLVGVVAGLVGAAALTGTLSALLFGVAPIDAAVFSAAAAGLVIVAMAGVYASSRRALGIDPLIALRHD